MTKKELGKALQKARINANMSCEELSKRLGNSNKTVYAWEYGNGIPDIFTLLELCKLYNISSINELIGSVVEKDYINTLRVEEKALLGTYRQLTPNSKQIVTTVARMELKHVAANNQAETPIKIIQKSKDEMVATLDKSNSKKNQKKQPLQVYTQSAAAGYSGYIDDANFDEILVKDVPRDTEFGIRISGDSMQPTIKDGDIVFVKRQDCIDVGEIGIFIYDGGAVCKQIAFHNDAYYLRSLNSKYPDMPILEDATYTVGKVLGKYNESEDT